MDKNMTTWVLRIDLSHHTWRQLPLYSEQPYHPLKYFLKQQKIVHLLYKTV